MKNNANVTKLTSLGKYSWKIYIYSKGVVWKKILNYLKIKSASRNTVY